MRLLLLVVLTVACVEDRRLSGPVFDIRVARAEFDLEIRREVDMMIVVDNSPRMESLRATLRANMPNFANVLSTIQGGLPDVHIGFVTTDCSDGMLGAASDNGRFLVDEKRGDGTRETNYDGTLGVALAASFDALPRSPCPDHQPLGVVLRALDHPANTGFVREHAMLVVLIISANDDASDLPIEQIATTLVEAKQDSSMVSVGVLAGPCRQELPLFGADGARRLRTFAAQFPNRNTVTTLCQQDLSGGLQLVSGLPDRPVNNPCLDVELADPPVCAMSLRILDEDQLVPACDRDPSGLCWRIRLDESQCPAAFHQRIVVEHYEPSALRAHVTMECAVPGHDML